MSEDCDFRITPLETHFDLSKQALRNQMRTFRNDIIEKLKNIGFTINPDQIMTSNLGQFMRLELYYESVFPQTNHICGHIFY